MTLLYHWHSHPVLQLRFHKLVTDTFLTFFFDILHTSGAASTCASVPSDAVVPLRSERGSDAHLTL